MKRRNIVIIIVVLIVIVASCAVTYGFTIANKKPEEAKVVVTELDNIEEYGYKLEDRDTILYKENFKSLRELLKSDEVSFEEYAKLISKLYIIDLYTIDNKVNQYDVGGMEFVDPGAKDNFDLKVKDTIYKYVEDNTYGKRNQDLPIVKSVNVDGIEAEKQKVGEQEFEGFSVKISWDYEKDLGYDKNAVLKLIKKDKLLYVIRQSVSA